MRGIIPKECEGEIGEIINSRALSELTESFLTFLFRITQPYSSRNANNKQNQNQQNQQNPSNQNFFSVLGKSGEQQKQQKQQHSLLISNSNVSKLCEFCLSDSKVLDSVVKTIQCCLVGESKGDSGTVIWEESFSKALNVTENILPFLISNFSYHEVAGNVLFKILLTALERRRNTEHSSQLILLIAQIHFSLLGKNTFPNSILLTVPGINKSRLDSFCKDILPLSRKAAIKSYTKLLSEFAGADTKDHKKKIQDTKLKQKKKKQKGKKPKKKLHDEDFSLDTFF